MSIGTKSPIFTGSQIPVGWRYLHGFLLDDQKESSTLQAVVKNTTTNESRLWIYDDPVRPYWIVPPAGRIFQQKRLSMAKEDLQELYVPQHELGAHIFEQLRGFKPSRPVHTRQMFDSPYVYGADIPVTVLERYRLSQQTPKAIGSVRVGFLDLETSVIGGKEIIAASYVDPECKVHQAVLESFLGKTKPERIIEKYNQARHQFADMLKAEPKALFLAHDWKLNLVTCKTELDLIRWLFVHVHRTKPDFVGIWNISYDLPYLVDRLAVHGVSPEMAFCHPDVPRNKRYFNWRPDKSDRPDHFTHRWHWATISGYTQWVDAQCLYSILRRTRGMQISYALDYIAELELGVGKLAVTKSHKHMQLHQFDDYVVYNSFDSILIKLMDMLNSDVTTMLLLAGPSDLNFFTKQTKRLQQELAIYGAELTKPRVPCSIGGSQETELDKRITNVGGGVLTPHLAVGTSVAIVKEIDRAVGMQKFVADIDGTSLYPSLTAACNVDRDTLRATMLGRDNEEGMLSGADIEVICSNIVSPVANAAWLAPRYFKLPGYQKMLELYDASVATAGQK